MSDFRIRCSSCELLVQVSQLAFHVADFAVHDRGLLIGAFGSFTAALVFDKTNR
jgi:hypothetical protein